MTQLSRTPAQKKVKKAKVKKGKVKVKDEYYSLITILHHHLNGLIIYVMLYSLYIYIYINLPLGGT